ncbi:MAG: CHAT domain-containing protein, partial [Chloroflexota bacterium]
KNHAEFVSLELPHAVLNNDIDQLRQSFLEKESDTDVSAKLYDLLIAPLKPHIQTTNLVIVPHQVLHHLPFAALWNEEDNRYLMEEYAITYAPSASTLKFIQAKRNRNQRRLLALGNPDGSLKAAENEVEAIAALFNTDPFLLDEATETQVHVQAQNVDILHLAAHGKYEDNNPLFTRIELAPDTVSGRDSDSDIEDSSTNDGWLEVHEIFNLNLSDANLVVLSACDTSNATMTRGDDLIGLPRAFIYAGAPAVITTLWPIDDDASAVLMETFYQHWLSGMTTAEALRSAQIDVMATDELASPYYWAAFQLNGDYR